MSATECADQTSAEAPSSQDAADGHRSTAPAAPLAPPRWLALCSALLCLAGVGVSIELTRIHVFVHTDPSYHSVCAMSEGINCETVAVSPYSVFAGVPVSVWGLAGYLLMGALALLGAVRRRPHAAWPWGLLLLLTSFSLLTSATLAWISATRIDSLCLFCLGSYAINVALFVVCVAAARRTKVGWRRLLSLDLGVLQSRPSVAALVAIGGLAGLAVLRSSMPAYWKTPGWHDLPQLASGSDSHGHHWIGARRPVLTVVEFSDYECPHCRAAHKAMRVLAAKYPRKLRLVHRHLPLDMACHPGLRRPFHRRACLFAEAAECAGRQGRFWEMNDALFSIQERVKTDSVDPVELAVRLGLDRAAFKRCLASHATAPRIEKDVRAAMARRLRGTPSFIVGDKLFLGRIPPEELARRLAGER